MYAIVEIAGKQYKVHENDKLVVPRLSGDVDDTVTFDRVLLVANGDEDIQLGMPIVPNATVTATIVEHVKGDKVLVFRKKRRKRFKVKRGHRQPYTRIEISDLSVDGSDKPAKKSSKPAAKKKGSTAANGDDKAEKAETGPKAAKADSKAKADQTDPKADEPTAAEQTEEATTTEAKQTKGAKKSENVSKSEQADSADDAADASDDDENESTS